MPDVKPATDRLSQGAGRYWLHLDVDVLSEEAFPAADYLVPGGLSLAELRDLMEPLARGTGLAALSLGCYNPGKDTDGSGARILVDPLGHLLC